MLALYRSSALAQARPGIRPFPDPAPRHPAPMVTTLALAAAQPPTYASMYTAHMVQRTVSWALLPNTSVSGRPNHYATPPSHLPSSSHPWATPPTPCTTTFLPNQPHAHFSLPQGEIISNAC